MEREDKVEGVRGMLEGVVEVSASRASLPQAWLSCVCFSQARDLRSIGLAPPTCAANKTQTMPDEATLSSALDAILDEQDRLAAEAEAAASAAAAVAAEAAAEEEKRNAKPDVAAVLASLTDEEIAAARKAALIRQYAYVEGGPEEDPLRKDGPPRASGKEEAEAKRAAEERRRLVEEALRLDGKKKKYRKKESECMRRAQRSEPTCGVAWGDD